MVNSLRPRLKALLARFREVSTRRLPNCRRGSHGVSRPSSTQRTWTASSSAGSSRTHTPRPGGTYWNPSSLHGVLGRARSDLTEPSDSYSPLPIIHCDTADVVPRHHTRASERCSPFRVTQRIAMRGFPDIAGALYYVSQRTSRKSRSISAESQVSRPIERGPARSSCYTPPERGSSRRLGAYSRLRPRGCSPRAGTTP